MQRQVADIRTRFAVVGLDAVQAAFRSTADALGRVTRISRQAGQAAGAAGQASQDAARRAAAAAREQVQAAARAAQEQLRQAQQAAQRQSQLARQQAAERIRLARESAAQAQRDAAEAARRASGARGPTPGMDPTQAAAARAARDLAQQQARDAAALARARAEVYRDELRQARVRAAQADREARRQVQAAQAAARAAADAASRQARQAAADAAARIRLIREEAAQRQAQVRAEAAARQAQLRADAQATPARVRALRDLARQQAAADRQRQAALRAQAQADEAAARAAVAAARAATGAQRAAARQAARDALERLRRSREAARQAEEEARRRQSELQRQADAEARIQRERERRAREQSRRELADIRSRAAADLRAEREAERARRDAERAARTAGQAGRRNADERRQGEQRVAGAVRDTTADIGRQEKAAGKLAAVFQKLGGLARGVTVKGLKIGAAGAVGAGAGAAGLAAGAFGLSKKATEDASEYVRSTYYASLSTGLDPQTFSLLADNAKKYGLELDDLRGSLIGFQGVIADSGRAGAGDPIFDQLKAVGVDIGPVNGKLKKTGELLIPILTALRKMNQTEKVGLMGKLFGEDDAGKLMPLFNELLDDPKMMDRAFQRQGQLGNFINARDLAIAKQYKAAVQDLSDAWHGFELEVANVVGPGVSSVLAAAAQDLGRNRVLIAQAFGRGVQWLGSVAGDILNMALKGSAYDAFVKNRWLLPAREAFATIGRIAKAAFRLIGEAYQTVMGNDAKVREFPWLITIRDGLTSAYTWVTKFVRDLFNVISFRDYNVSGAFPWMTTIRDKAVEFVEYLKKVWGDLQGVFSGGDSASTGPGRMLLQLVQGFEATRQYIDGWALWFKQVGADIAHVWEQIGAPEKDKAFNFAWMKSLADGFWFVADAAKQGYDWFKKVYDTIFSFVKEYTGLNFESMLFFVAFLKFTGTLTALTAALGLVLKPLKILAGLVLGIGGAGAAAGTITALTTAWEGLLATLGGIAALATNPLILAILGGVAGGVGLASLLKGSVIDQAISDLERWISDVDNSPGLKRLREAGENPTQEERFRGAVRAGTQQMSDWPQWQQQQREYDVRAAEWEKQLERERQAAEAQRQALDFRTQPAAPRNSVTINLADGRQVNASQSDDQYAQLLRDFRRAQ